MHRILKRRHSVHIELPSGGSLKDVLAGGSCTTDDATAATASFSASSANTTSSRRNSVQFDLAANQLYTNIVIDSEEVHELWYSRDEYKAFRRQTHSLAKQIAKLEAQSMAEHSYERTVTRVSEACQTCDAGVTCADQRHLNRWAQAAPSRHGLDKWALVQLGKHRTAQRQELQQTIVGMQSKIIKDECYVDTLRTTSERMSQASRSFARAMAISLAHSEQTVQSMM